MTRDEKVLELQVVLDVTDKELKATPIEQVERRKHLERRISTTFNLLVGFERRRVPERRLTLADFKAKEP